MRATQYDDGKVYYEHNGDTLVLKHERYNNEVAIRWLVGLFNSSGIEVPYESRDRFVAAVENCQGFYYARPRESFDVREALHLCRKAGRRLLILEDLS